MSKLVSVRSVPVFSASSEFEEHVSEFAFFVQSMALNIDMKLTHPSKCFWVSLLILQILLLEDFQCCKS